MGITAYRPRGTAYTHGRLPHVYCVGAEEGSLDFFFSHIGVPLAARQDELKCGVAAVDLTCGRVCARLEFQTAVEEIFDVQLLRRQRFPEVMGFQKDTIQHTFVIPPVAARASEPISVNGS